MIPLQVVAVAAVCAWALAPALAWALYGVGGEPLRLAGCMAWLPGLLPAWLRPASSVQLAHPQLPTDQSRVAQHATYIALKA